ncbi:hypothetical protein WA158_000020 [Blastocystis sp. Blastoise]
MHFTNWKGHQDSVTCVICDGDRAISGSEDKTIRVWDLKTETTVNCIVGVFNDAVMSVVSNPTKSHQVFAAAGKTIYEFDLRNYDVCLKEYSNCFSENDDDISQIVIDDDGHYLASADDSGSVSIYNLWTEQNEITVTDMHSNICSSVMFYREGRNVSVISGGMDFKVYNWNLEGDVLHEWSINPSQDPGTSYINPPFVTSLCKDYRSNNIFCSCGDGSLRQLLFNNNEYLQEVNTSTRPHYAACTQVLSAYNSEGTHLLIGAGDDMKISVSSNTGNTKYDQQLHVKLRNKPNCCAFVDSSSPSSILVASTAQYILNIHGIA